MKKNKGKISKKTCILQRMSLVFTYVYKKKPHYETEEEQKVNRTHRPISRVGNDYTKNTSFCLQTHTALEKQRTNE